MNKIGFSTLELLIALALMSVIMTAAVSAIESARYWQVTTQTSNEALYIRNKILNTLVVLQSTDFQTVSSTKETSWVDVDVSSGVNCLVGRLCYFTKNTVTDISSCAKEINVAVSFRSGLRYSTSSVESTIYYPNNNEIVARSGDCLIKPLSGHWGTKVSQLGSSLESVTQQNTGVDVFNQKMYITSIFEPQLRIYDLDTSPSVAPMLIGSSTGSKLRLNDIEVIRDMLTNRIYAYVMQHSTTSQLAVYDVTDSRNPAFLLELPLFNVASNGSFPQGWRVVAYGGQLFVVSRETTGPELHIFSIQNPRLPVEITSSAINLNRTVNDMTVRDEMVAGVKRRFLYLAASADLKELGVYDVTNPVPVEIAAINLAGTADASAIFVTGNTLYLGRKSSTVSELYAFNLAKLIKNELELLGTNEIGTDVLALSSTGKQLIVGTSKSGSELQIWNTDTSTWSSSVVNAGRLSYFSSPRLAPLGFDIGEDNLYLVSQSASQPETISVVYTP